MTDVLTEANNILDQAKTESTVTISKFEYAFLRTGAKILAALQASGVQEWEGFETAVKSVEAEGAEVVKAVEAAVVE
jgi:hypothetical protein